MDGQMEMGFRFPMKTETRGMDQFGDEQFDRDFNNYENFELLFL